MFTLDQIIYSENSLIPGTISEYMQVNHGVRIDAQFNDDWI